ncbi:hypothetical protein H7J07_05200 [Mycobacterium koreense]|nr:hypothetical protein [Mycolicibacillus koreensis]MCV7247621.1 hypothetical protein [Mycolicibacillus koreensis]BBY54000.1 hypothetical protein MKOR_12510 [Mycolicibacillus koreensis]
MGDTVWVLKIDHRHGTDATVHKTKQGAEEALLAYVHEWWDEAATRIGADIPAEPPADSSAAIDMYFATQGDEFFEIDETSVS